MNIVEQTKKDISILLDKRNKETLVILNKIDALSDDLAVADAGMKVATEKLDFSAFESAKNKRNQIAAELEMYNTRLDQLNKKEYVTEAESDKTISALKEYQDVLAAKYSEAIADPLNRLEAITADYLARVSDTEETLSAWVNNIHANYRSDIQTFSDTGTNRSRTPIPVRQVPFRGCDDSMAVSNFLEKMKNRSAFEAVTRS